MLILRPASLTFRQALRTVPKQSTLKQLTPLATRTNFSTTSPFRMPDSLKSSEVNSKTDPSVAKQWDHDTPMHQQWEEFYGKIYMFAYSS